MEERTVSVADLRLDGLNPRLEAQAGEREIIAALIEDQGDKLLNLADDIATHGLSPICDVERESRRRRSIRPPSIGTIA